MINLKPLCLGNIYERFVTDFMTQNMISLPCRDKVYTAKSITLSMIIHLYPNSL